MFALDEIDCLTGGKIGTFDIACPVCGPQRNSHANRIRKVLRMWRITGDFATYRCARCDLHGYACDHAAPKPDIAELAKARMEAKRFGFAAAEERRRKARWLWSKRQPPGGTVVETYLRARRYGGPLPEAIGFLPANGGFPPAMIAAFAVPLNGEPTLNTASIEAVHITRLALDGTGKAGTNVDKIMIGTPRGTPIALAPITDGLGLAITEGIENGLSIFEATGLGVWAAGSAPFLPALADTVPTYVEAVSIIADPDDVGRRFARDLAVGLHKRGIGHQVLAWKLGRAA
jgi:Toprim domain-containing protein